MDAKVSSPLEETREAYNSREYKTAIEKATDTIKGSPRCYEAWVLRGAALLQQDSPYAALLNFTKAISINNRVYDAWNNRGTSYFRLCMWDEAIADFNQSIALAPNAYMSYFQLGLLYSAIERPAEAEFNLRQALRWCPEDDNNFNLINIYFATLLQGLGHWQEGFKRDQRRYNILTPRRLTPTWQGEDLTGKRLFVFTESGWGDKILSLRYINLLREKYPGVKITVGTQPDLLSLIKSSFDLRVTNRLDVERDYAVSLTDVPMVLNLTWDTVPRPTKYLSIDPKVVEGWAHKFKTLPKGVNVGLCWASMNGISKTIPPWDMVEIGGVPQINFISLQKPYVQAPKELKLIDWTNEINDWADTGAIIENCDIIITIDTGVAHLAGALGKPVWNIVRYSTYWPWMAADIPPSKDYSIWYPSMTLFRQKQYGDWLEPMRKVTLELQRQLAGLT